MHDYLLYGAAVLLPQCYLLKVHSKPVSRTRKVSSSTYKVTRLVCTGQRHAQPCSLLYGTRAGVRALDRSVIRDTL